MHNIILAKLSEPTHRTNTTLSLFSLTLSNSGNLFPASGALIGLLANSNRCAVVTHAVDTTLDADALHTRRKAACEVSESIQALLWLCVLLVRSAVGGYEEVTSWLKCAFSRECGLVLREVRKDGWPMMINLN